MKRQIQIITIAGVIAVSVIMAGDGLATLADSFWVIPSHSDTPIIANGANSQKAASADNARFTGPCGVKGDAVINELPTVRLDSSLSGFVGSAFIGDVAMVSRPCPQRSVPP